MASIDTRTVPADITAGTETVLRMLPIRGRLFAWPAPQLCAEPLLRLLGFCIKICSMGYFDIAQAAMCGIITKNPF